MGSAVAVKSSKRPVYIYVFLSLAALFFIAAAVLVACVGLTSEDYALYLASSNGVVIENPVEVIMRTDDVEITEDDPPLAFNDIGGMHKIAGCAAVVVILICGAPLAANFAASRRLARAKAGKK